MGNVLARLPDPGRDSEHPGLTARVFGALFLCGAALVSLSLVLSHPASSTESAIVAIVILAALSGITLIMAGDHVRIWMLHAATAGATALVCLAIYFSGVSSGVYAMMFVWIVVMQSYFFPGRAAMAQLAWLLLAYGVTLAALGSSDGYAPLTRWLLTALTLIVASVIASWLVLGRRRAERQTRRFFDLSQDMLCTTGPLGYFVALNDAWTRSLGYTLDELRSRPFLELVHPADRVATETRMARLLDDGTPIALENRFRAKDGTWHWLTWSAVRDDEEGLVYARATDATERKLLERQREDLLTEVESLARTDALTGLPNRRALDEVLEHELARSLQLDSQLCVAIIDLDHFKRFNDRNGHAAGDEFLRDAAELWRGELRASDFMGRYGGEEFVVVLPDCGPAGAEVVVDRLRAVVPREETCSAGLARWDSRMSAAELLDHADAALYRAKSAGRDRLVIAT